MDRLEKIQKLQNLYEEELAENFANNTEFDLDVLAALDALYIRWEKKKVVKG